MAVFQMDSELNGSRYRSLHSATAVAPAHRAYSTPEFTIFVTFIVTDIVPQITKIPNSKLVHFTSGSVL